MRAAVSSASSQDRANQSLGLIVNSILPHLRGVRPGRRSTEWTFHCPLEHRKSNASAVIWLDEEGWISVHCFDCKRQDELREAIISPAIRHGNPWNSQTMPNPAGLHNRTKHQDTATLKTWERSHPIPSGDHPTRRWMQHRNLWHPEVQVPGSLRWIDAASTFPGPHTGAGSIVALLAPLAWWQAAWPGLPRPSALEIIAIDADGRPSLDRPAAAGGLSKRTLGSKQGCFLVIGSPVLSSLPYPVRVAEGVADALSLAARSPGPAVATMGDAGMGNEDLARWLAQASEGVVIHADDDAAGVAGANRLRAAITVAGGRARAVRPTHGKDAADASALTPLPQRAKLWPAFAESLREKYSWPQWEAQRQATILTTENLERL